MSSVLSSLTHLDFYSYFQRTNFRFPWFYPFLFLIPVISPVVLKYFILFVLDLIRSSLISGKGCVGYCGHCALCPSSFVVRCVMGVFWDTHESCLPLWGGGRAGGRAITCCPQQGDPGQQARDEHPAGSCGWRRQCGDLDGEAWGLPRSEDDPSALKILLESNPLGEEWRG